MNKAKLIPDLPCGVLGEDPVFNASVMQRIGGTMAEIN